MEAQRTPDPVTLGGRDKEVPLRQDLEGKEFARLSGEGLSTELNIVSKDLGIPGNGRKLTWG